ncbi:MAG: TRAP transporter small permease [Oscillospiraceae bacterium]|nr:TRAP transporter small permease [Oscillospiraceae bacterium]
MNKILDYIEESLVCVCLIVMTALTFVNVVARYVFSASLSFSEEITTYLFVLLSLLGSAIAAKRGAHLGLTIITDKVGPKAGRILGIISMAFATAFSAIICYFGFFMALNQYNKGQLTAGTQLPEWIFGSFVPIGALFVTIRFAQNLIRLLTGKDIKHEDVVADALENAANEEE